MSVRYIFNTSGEYVAFLSNNYLFSPDAEWIGFVSSGNEVYRPDGSFMGYLMDDDRVVRRRGEPARPRLPRPMRPMGPMRPMRPMRRLRMPRLQHPVEDVFEHGSPASMTQSAFGSFDQLEGASLLLKDGTFLGTVTRNVYDQNSIANQFGPYGSRYSPTSIWNEYGQYGGPYGAHSPFNQYSSGPPQLIKAGASFGYLTVNAHLSPRTDPNELLQWLGA